MRHAIDFLDNMVRDVLDFDITRLQELKVNEISIKLFPAAPARALNEIMLRVSQVFAYKYTRVKNVSYNGQVLILDDGLKRINVELCYTLVDARGSTCAGAMIDTHRFLNSDTHRALVKSMQTMRSLGFIAHTVTMPLEF